MQHKNNKITTYYATYTSRKTVFSCKNNKAKTCYATYTFRNIFLHTTLCFLCTIRTLQTTISWNYIITTFYERRHATY